LGGIIRDIKAKTARNTKVFNAESADYVVQDAIYGLLEVPFSLVTALMATTARQQRVSELNAIGQ
jgi:hypothetical protein